MDNKSIIKYENLLLRIHERCEARDLNELGELIDYLVARRRTHDAVAVLRLVLFYQPEIPELWAKMGDLQTLNSKPDESHAAHREALRIIRNRRNEEEYTHSTGLKFMPPQSSGSRKPVYAA